MDRLSTDTINRAQPSTQPTGQGFRGQRDGEELIFRIRRHPWSISRAGLVVALGLAILIATVRGLGLTQAAGLVTLIILPLLIVYGLYAWFSWWKSVYLVTSDRIIIITQHGILFRRVEDYSLDKIQSVVSDHAGLAATVMNFGTIELAVMGVKEPVLMPCVEDAHTVQERILEAIKN